MTSLSLLLTVGSSQAGSGGQLPRPQGWVRWWQCPRIAPIILGPLHVGGDSEDSGAPQTRTPCHICTGYLEDLAAKRALGEGTASSERCPMGILNPEEADSKAGTSGTDEVAVSGDLWGWGSARPLSTTFPLYCLGVGGCLPHKS